MQLPRTWTLMVAAALLLPGPATPIPTAATQAQVMAAPILGATLPTERMAGVTATQSAIRNPPSAIQETGIYTETFTTYTAKHYTDDTEWDIWAHQLRLARVDGISQQSPAVAVMSSTVGALAFVVWQDYRNGNWDIYAQRLDANGNKVWMEDVRVDSDSGILEQSCPDVAVDGSGNALVVWSDRRNGNPHIYAQKVDANGNKAWAADARVDSSNYGICPTVAVDGSGNAFVVWEDWRNGNEDVYAQKLDANGNKAWETDVRVNSDSGTASQQNPAVSLDSSSGHAFVVWYDDQNGDGDICAQKIDTNGNRVWMADVRVNSDSGTAAHDNLAVAVDDGGNAFVVWEDTRNGKDDFYAQKVDANGNKMWAADVHVNSDNSSAIRHFPAVAVDGGGIAVVVWSSYSDGNYDIYAQKVNANGETAWAVDVLINRDIGTGGDSLAVAVDPSGGDAFVVWEDIRNGNWDIYAEKLGASGDKAWVTDVLVNSDGGTANQTGPAVAVDGGGNAFVVWEDTRNGNRDIYARKVDTNGNKAWAADVRVNSDGGTANQMGPAVAVDEGGNAFVVWEESRGGNWDIYAQKLDANGNKAWGADVCVKSDTGPENQGGPAPAVAPSGTNAIVVWGESRSGNRGIYAQKLDGAGNKAWAADVRISDSGQSPAVAGDGGDNAVVVWGNDIRAGYGQGCIYAQKVDASGSKLWAADVRINSDSCVLAHTLPEIGMDPSGGDAFVVWTEGSGFYTVYAQKVDANGNKAWVADMPFNSDEGGETWPAVAVYPSGSNALVVWQQDYYNNNWNIYAQKLDANGNKAWTADVRVNSDSGEANQYYPAVAVDGGGNALVVWEDSRNGNSDIYAQKINLVGGKGWLADLQVVYPDLFYLPAGTAQSGTVDTATGDIRQATLTADYTLNGGGVQFYLTNDGGTNWLTATLGVAAIFTTSGSDLRWKAVLTRDPLWPRAPVIHSLRVESSTQVAYADDYEPDDTCAGARPIAVNGATQAHTFHQTADADWVWFDVISGTTYIVETYNTGARAQTVAEARRTCAAPPTGAGRSFGNGYTVSFTADQTARYYVKINNHSPSIYGQDTGYNLSVRSVRPHAVAIVVAGHDSANSVQENITYAADRAYKVFMNAGLGKANVRYLSPLASHDADGDGNNDISGPPTPANVRGAIQTWARERGVALGVPLYVYLVDHGLVDRFKADGDALASHVTATDLNLWLSNLEATTGTDNVNVILDACYSGSFIDVTTPGPGTISGRNRVVIASTTSEWQAFGPEDGKGLYFSNAFFSAVENEQSLWASYLEGKQAVAAQDLPQQPWLDDTGDQRSDNQDGALARERVLRRVAVGGQSPRIEWITASRATGVVQAKVTDDSAWVGIQMEVFAPSYVPPAPDGSGTTRIIDVPVVTLTDPDGDGVYVGTYVFAESGRYRLVAHAEDAEGNLALPVSAFASWVVYLPLAFKGQ